ncbi:hypothetical protein MKX01_037465 [Papaver californicum]|nr:hypothetical protein MKX01_037465 [Papaver californicum]
MAGDSSPLSSSGCDDFIFAALLDEQLAGISDQEEEEVDDTDFAKAQRIKRQRLENACAHPSLIKGMCIKCGQVVDDDDVSAVTLDYIHRDLKVGTQELARLRQKDLKSLFRKKKLCLVLDLDHTLLNPTKFQHISPEEEYLKTQIDSVNLFRLNQIQMFTKLRPFVRTFLKEASSLFEMYIYTMGEKRYAVEMAPYSIQKTQTSTPESFCRQIAPRNIKKVLMWCLEQSNSP